MHPSKEQFRNAVSQVEKLSPAPVILVSAMKLLRDPRSDMNSLSTLVGRDAALTSDIIRCANTAYYAGQRSSNIMEAVQKIGTGETMRLLKLAVARIVCGRDLGCYGITGADYWAESLFNGLFLKDLAKETGGADPDDAYTAGLLRFIGRLAINQAIENMQGGLFWNASIPISQWELDSVGVVQAKAGGALLGKWRFSEATVQAISAQDAPATLTEGNWLADALHFTASVLPQGLGTPFVASVGDNQPNASRIAHAVSSSGEFMQRHNLDPDAVDTKLQQTSKTFAEIHKSFGG